MKDRLENSDSEFAERKQMLDEGLAQAAQAAHRLADTVVPRVQAAADRAQTPNVRENLDRVRQDLRNAAQKATQLNKETPVKEALEATKALGTRIEPSKERIGRQCPDS